MGMHLAVRAAKPAFSTQLPAVEHVAVFCVVVVDPIHEDGCVSNRYLSGARSYEEMCN